jgi:hypothetical protein
VIIDLRELDYEWGDDLDMPSPERTYVPLLALVRPEQVGAYSGVLHDLRTDVEQVFQEISERIRSLRV